jgi:hypothetical protein
MRQTSLDLDLLPTEAEPRLGFSLGVDHARLALSPPAAMLAAGHPVGDGHRAGQAMFGRRRAATSPAQRAWIALRLRAWNEGLAIDAALSPAALARLFATHCPLTRRPLGGTGDTAAEWHTLRPGQGFAVGTLVMASREGVAALRSEEAAGREGAGGHSLAALALRARVLRSFATPMPHAEAAALPMPVLPPPGVVPVNAVQRVQAALTLMLAMPGWAGRWRGLAARAVAMTPAADRAAAEAAAEDFLLLLAALAPRRVAWREALSPREQHHALEDLWLDERVQRRWRFFATALGQLGCERWQLVLRATHTGGGLRRPAAGSGRPGLSARPRRGAAPGGPEAPVAATAAAPRPAAAH